MRERMGNAILVQETQALFGFGVVRDWPDREILERFCTGGSRRVRGGIWRPRAEAWTPWSCTSAGRFSSIRTMPRTPSRPRFWCSCTGRGRSASADSLASWLFGVAMRVSSHGADMPRSCGDFTRSKPASLRPQAHRRRAEKPRPWQHHEEIARLPERFREAILICYLEGLSTA